MSSDPARYVNLCVAVYECESTGGSEWLLEDTIHLRNIHLPRVRVDPNLDLSYLYDTRFLQKKQKVAQVRILTFFIYFGVNYFISFIII